MCLSHSKGAEVKVNKVKGRCEAIRMAFFKRPFLIVCLCLFALRLFDFILNTFAMRHLFKVQIRIALAAPAVVIVVVLEVGDVKAAHSVYVCVK